MLSRIQDFSSLQSDNFWNTISWKCFLKDDCIRSSLIECQSFLHCKININPIYRVLVFLPCVMQGIVHEGVHLSQSFQDLYALCPWDQ